jgi:hypothetical protein
MSHSRSVTDKRVFLRRIYDDMPGEPGTARTYLFEVFPSGQVPREVGLDRDGRPTLITRPGDYPITDYPVPPGSPSFDETFAGAERITRDEFEAAYALADAVLG